MFKTIAASLTAALALTASAHAIAADVPSGTYAIESSHTEVLFSVMHFGFSNYYGQFPGATGTLTLDAKTPANSQLDVSIPVGQVWTASPRLVEELKSADWFNAATYPTMTFHSTKVTQTSDTTADIEGNLTMHGVTHPITLKATFNKGAPNPMNQHFTTGFEVSGVVKRSEFGVNKYVPFVSDDVKLIISAAFERQAK